MQMKLFKQQPIPKTSQEAFDILSCSYDLDDIQSIFFNFKQLVSIRKSVLTSHALPNSTVPDNQAFIIDLETRINRLQTAVAEEKPYPTLYGDVCKVKESLGVILGYYQSQIKKDQPIASSFVRDAQSPSSQITALASEVASDAHPTLNKIDSRMLTKYTINYCATDIMEDDVATIAEIVQKPFLADHSDDPKFSYI
ncbi:hypothetical protein OQJ26_04520 [Legionella sp. PATHC038]|uniref:hypothetical protein n=1 Tax=Legionella sheltonii TaxID=2992041 RepID=UPI0022439C2E|nr:hypothetical protein [Legionella sp. PATHC038]MCW8398055.1 hypothetical protein [Legionella sp. PATHC038]